MRAAASAPETDFLCSVPAVSGWCVAEHLDHMVKVSNSILQAVVERQAPPLPSGITPVGRIVLTLGWLPRGRGKSPERLWGRRVSSAELLAALQDLEASVDGLDLATLKQSTRPTVKHAKFGGLNAAQALRFVDVHNDHHLQIIDDIRAKRAAG